MARAKQPPQTSSASAGQKASVVRAVEVSGLMTSRAVNGIGSAQIADKAARIVFRISLARFLRIRINRFVIGIASFI
jgi:hypothetical protein